MYNDDCVFYQAKEIVMSTQPKEILLNMMYTGSYLDAGNIGHEIINLFKSDNGENYIYVLPWGTMHPTHNNKIESILLVRRCNATKIEILAKATGLTQIAGKEISQRTYIKENNITYGNVQLDKIFQGNADEADVTLISFRAENVRKVKEPLFVDVNDLKEKNFNFPRQSPKRYVSSTEHKNAYNHLNTIINDDSKWQEKNTTQKIDVKKYADKKQTLMEIISKEYDELSYSNLLAYFFQTYPSYFQKFAKNVLKIDDFEPQFIVNREEKNIDLLIKDKSHVIVIENKIRSGINGIQENCTTQNGINSQLNKYYKIVQETYSKKACSFFVLTPNYNTIDLSKYDGGEHYSSITYSDLYTFFEKNPVKDGYYQEFLSALKIHAATTDNRREEEMYYRFAKAISDAVK